MSASRVLEAERNPVLTFTRLEREMRKRNYGVLCSVSKDGRPHSAGVIYAVSARDKPFALNIVTDRRSKKARNAARNPNVAFVIPIHKSPGFVPPNSIQFQGMAEILPLTDTESRQAFEASVVLRRVLKLQLAQKEEVSTFIRVRPDCVIFTYGVGVSLLKLMRHVEAASSRVDIPSDRL